MFLLDDHPVVRWGVRDLLEDTTDLVVEGDSDDPADLAAAIERGAVDVAVVDISLAQHDGLDVIRQLVARGVDTRILVLSVHEDSYYAERCLRAGASGYVNKAEAGEKVLGAIRKVLRGGVAVSEELGARPWRHAIRDGGAKDPVERLSDRELEVFRGYGDGCSSKEIGERLGVSVKTVETHRAHIKEKLGIEGGAALVAYAVRWKIEHS